MKSAFYIALGLALCVGLAYAAPQTQAGTPATTAVHNGTNSTTAVTPVRGYRGYRPYYRPYYARPYFGYRPYVYRPYVYGPWPYPAYGFGYPYSIRSPYYFGYRYPGARNRGYRASPGFYPPRVGF